MQQAAGELLGGYLRARLAVIEEERKVLLLLIKDHETEVAT